MANPKLRFKRPDGTGYQDWKSVQLADIATRVTRKNKDGETDVPLTIASIEGLVDQRTYFGKTVASKDMSGYFLLKNGEFAYNKSYSVGYDYGAIKRLDKYDQGALSTLYICFALNDTSWSDFMVQYFDSLKWNAEMPKICAEGARNHGLLNVAPADFFKISMALPADLEERDRIVEGLQRITERIECQAASVAALETQKKELLRQVFAREIRFKDENGQDYPEWEVDSIGNLFQITRGYVLAMPKTRQEQDSEFLYPVYSSQTKNDGLMGYYTEYLYEDAITWTTDGANAGTVRFRKGKFYCTNVCGVLLKKKLIPNLCVAEILNVAADPWVTHNGNPKLMNNVMSEIRIRFPSDVKEQQRIADFFTALDTQIENERALLEDWRQLKKGLLQQMFV